MGSLVEAWKRTTCLACSRTRSVRWKTQAALWYTVQTHEGKHSQGDAACVYSFPPDLFQMVGRYEIALLSPPPPVFSLIRI